MIQVTLGQLVFCLLAGMLSLIFGAWLISESRRRRREHLAFRSVLHCTMCGCEFEDPSPEPVVSCPRCGTKNERLRPSRL